MSPVQTLHDFALNLLNDPTALAAFGTDPQQALAAAGLGDVSAADVHEVIPLVLDYVPVGSVANVGELPALGTDAPGIQGAIDQLTALTQGLGLPATGALPGVGELPGVGSLPVSDLPAIGDLGHLPGVSALPVNDVTNVAAGYTALAGDPSGALTYAQDLAGNLDAGALGQLGQLTDANHSLAASTEDRSFNTVSDLTDANHSLAAGTADHALNSVDHLGNHAISAAHVGDFTGVLGNAGDLDVKHVGGDLTHAVAGEVHNVTHVADHATGGAVSHVADTATSAVGVSDVHDTVSNVAGDATHDLAGNLHVGDITHDLHLGL